MSPDTRHDLEPTVDDVDPNPYLADMTSLRVGGPADRYVLASSEAELVETVRAADDAGIPVLVIGGGSNLLVSDEGFGGVVVRDGRQGVEVDAQDTCGGASVHAPAGQDWDALVARAVGEGWVGLEALSGIPGTLGAAPVQNIGAYGQEVAGVVASVRTYDRAQQRVRTLAFGELGFAYRTSLLKESMYSPADGGPWYPTPRFVVLDVALQMRLGTLSAPVAYPELARTLGVQVGDRAPSDEVRAAVLALRAGKGMLLDPAVRPDAPSVGRPNGSASDGTVAPDHDRWSAGSFFTNPVIPVEGADRLPEGAPRYPVRSPLPSTTTGPSLGVVDPAWVKTSAAWLIEHAGFGKGWGVHGEASLARLSTRHTLALTNRGGASAQDVVQLARAVRDGVLDAFGVELVPEPVLVGLSL